MLAGLCRLGTIGKCQYRALKVVRKAFNIVIVEVWNLVCCDCNKIVQLILRNTSSTIVL